MPRPRPAPRSHADPRLSNIVDSTGHWFFPFVVAPLFALGALLALASLVALCISRWCVP